MNEPRPAALIFDLDGTLIDSLPGIEHSVRSAFVQCGIPCPQLDLGRMIGPPIHSILAQAAGTSQPSLLACLETAFRLSYDTEGWKRSTCYPGVEDALRGLRVAGILLFIVTNKPLHITTRILEEKGIHSLFESILTRDSRLPAYLDKKQMIDSLIHSFALRTKDCLLVGDTGEDASAASACNLRFIYMKHGYGILHQPYGLPCHASLDNFSQLPQCLGLEFAHDR